VDDEQGEEGGEQRCEVVHKGLRSCSAGRGDEVKPGLDRIR
jgi:hypothetical protein